MPVTTFLKEKIRDPRVKGAPFSNQAIIENFDINFVTNAESPLSFDLKFDPVLNNNITLSFSELNTEDIIFTCGISSVDTHTILKDENTDVLQIEISYDGRRNFSITYTITEGYDNLFPIEEIITFNYFPESYQFIETTYMQYDTSTPIARFSSPTIYLHGKLADSDAIVATNLSSNAVTTAKLSQNCVTAEKIANGNVTWAKLRCAIEEIPQSGGKYKWRIY